MYALSIGYIGLYAYYILSDVNVYNAIVVYNSIYMK